MFYNISTFFRNKKNSGMMKEDYTQNKMSVKAFKMDQTKNMKKGV